MITYMHATCEFDHKMRPTKTVCDVYTGTAFYDRNKITVDKNVFLSFFVFPMEIEYCFCIKCCRICLIDEIVE